MFVENWKDRLSACAAHLLICIAIAAAAALLIFFVWYPRPLSAAVGATQLFLLVLAVDIALGPLLTLAVFDRRKKSLVFDLALIAMVQFGALTYGLYTMYQGKPTYIVLNEDQFFLVPVKEIELQWYARPGVDSTFSPKDLYQSPKWAAVKWPEDVKARNELLFSNSSARVDAYITIDRASAQVKSIVQPIEKLNAFNKGREQELLQVKEKWKAEGVHTLGFVPLRGELEDMAVLVNGSTGNVLEIVRFAPWL